MKIQNKNKLIVVLISAITVLAVAAYFSVGYATKALWPFNQTGDADSSEQRDQDDINYAPPTEQEIESSQDGKKRGENPANQPTNDISVDVAYLGKSDDGNNIEIRAFTPDVIESDGKCTATLMKDGARVTGESLGFIDARSTICPPIEIPLSKLTSGTWQVIVTYSSSKSAGSSQQMEVQV